MDQNLNDTPADVLVEARRNLKALIDSGISREALLALIADSPSTAPQQAVVSRSLPPQPQTPIKEEMPMMVNMTCPSMPQQQPDIKLSSSPMQAAHVMAPPHPQMMDGQATIPMPIFAPPPVTQYGARGHHPRISISSTSSGSSGHASIWSQNSAISTASSAASTYSAPASTSAAWSNSRQNFYWCTSCETRFKRKYDWKRHEEEFHERWKKYPCPEPGCNRSFWGANTFNQHHKSSHGCRTCPHSEKVVKFLRKRKYWACGFCSALHPSRERHVEHVARHFEAGKSKADWMHSRVIYGLLHQPLIHEAWKEFVASKHGEIAPNFSWNPTKTGRAQGFMENECPGQLQDLLEFFSGNQTEAESIVKVAYDLSDIVYAPAQPPSLSLESPGHPVSMSYPTPPESSLSPITPGSAIMAQPSPQQAKMESLQQQQLQQLQIQHMHQQHHHQLQHRHSAHSLISTEPTSPTGYSTYQSMMQPGMFATLSSPQSMPQLQLKSSGSIRRASLERALPPPPAEVTAAPVQSMGYDFGIQQSFADWSSFSGNVMEDPMQQAHNPAAQSQMQQQSQQQHHHHPLQTDWPMMQFYAPQ